VAPGCYVHVRNGQPEVTVRWYDVLSDIDPDYYEELSHASFDDVTRRLRALLESSVEAMLMSDVPIGAFVSGGIDSGVVASMAAPRRDDLTLFTADVVGQHSEVEDARQLARHTACPLREARFLPETPGAGRPFAPANEPILPDQPVRCCQHEQHDRGSHRPHHRVPGDVHCNIILRAGSEIDIVVTNAKAAHCDQMLVPRQGSGGHFRLERKNDVSVLQLLWRVFDFILIQELCRDLRMIPNGLQSDVWKDEFLLFI